MLFVIKQNKQTQKLFKSVFPKHYSFITFTTFAYALLKVPIYSVSPIKSAHYLYFRASQVVLVVKDPPANAGDVGKGGSIPGSRGFQILF